MRARDKKGGKENEKEGGKQQFFSAPSRYLYKNKYYPALKWSVVPYYMII